MIDYSNIYVATKERGPSKKHGSRSLSNGLTKFNLKNNSIFKYKM
jgi:hypothetical protein